MRNFALRQAKHLFEICTDARDRERSAVIHSYPNLSFLFNLLLAGLLRNRGSVEQHVMHQA